MIAKLIEALLVYALVVACTGYSGWTFLPINLKRRIALALMARSTRLKSVNILKKLAMPVAGCAAGCGNCRNNPATGSGSSANKLHIIQIIKRR